MTIEQMCDYLGHVPTERVLKVAAYLLQADDESLQEFIDELTAELEIYDKP